MKKYFLAILILLSQKTFSQQKADSGIYIKFISGNIKDGTFYCNLIVDEPPVIHTKDIEIPNNSTYYWIACDAVRPVRIFQNGCTIIKSEIKGKDKFYRGDSILVDIDKNTTTIINRR